MFLRIYLSFIFCILCVLSATGQAIPAQSLQFNELPVQFLQVVKNYPLLNPAYAAVDSGVNVVSGNKMNFGAFRIFRTNYLSATSRIPASRDSISRNYHGIGISAVTDKNGEYISHNRLYLTYAYTISLAENFHLSTGLSFGLVNHVIDGSSVSPRGSALAPDANIGVWLFGKKSYLGLSLNQVFNSRLTPLTETSLLLRHLNLAAGKTFFLSPFFQLTSSLVIRAAKDHRTDLDLVNLFLIKDRLSAGFNYKHQKGVVWMAGLENIPFRQGRHMAGGWFSYSIPFGKYGLSNMQTYEITLTYKIL